MSDTDEANEKILNEFSKNSDDDSSDEENQKQKPKANTSAEVASEGLSEEQLKQRKEDVTKTIFVGNLVTSTKKKHVIQLFKQFGKVKSARLRTIDGKKFSRKHEIKDSPSVNAYVVFETEKSAQKALSLSGTKYKTNHIRVDMADNKEGDGKKEMDPKRLLFVGNLKYSATDEKLYNIFEACGEIEYVRTLRNEKGCSGVAYVCFKSKDSVQLAIELNGTILDERPIRVDRYVVKYKETKQVQDRNPKMNKKFQNNKFKNSKTSKSYDRSQNFKKGNIKKFDGPNKKIEHSKKGNVVQKQSVEKNNDVKNIEGTAKKEKKSKLREKLYEGKKVARTKKKSKLGKGKIAKKGLIKKIAPRKADGKYGFSQ